ncbi:MAG: hypothetical protein ACXWE5_04195 [Actinomycetota bacterium]
MEGMVRKRRLVVAGAIALTIGLVPACSSDDSSSASGDTSSAATTGSTGGTAGAVPVTLQEFAVSAPASAPAGEITFDVTNNGPNDVHEFVVFKTDLAATDLPVDKTGAVVEDGEGVEHVDEIEDIAVGDTQSLTVDLDAGSYVLICNIYSEDEQEAHYAEGMRIGFTVE